MTIEPNGKDLATAGGSRDRSDAIAREVFEREPPLNVPYEFLNIGGRKMSTSKGRGAAAHTIAEVVPPEQLRFLFLRHRPNHAIDFDPEGTDQIPRLFDEFDKFAAATAGREVRGDLPPGYEATFRYSLLDPDADVVAGGGRLPTALRPPGDCSSRSRASTWSNASRRRRGARSPTTSGRCSTSAPGRRAPGSTTYAPESARLTIHREARPDRASPSCDADTAPLPGPPGRTGLPRRAGERRRLADPDLHDRDRGGRRRSSGVRGDLPRVPRSTERTARGLAARQPRPGIRRSGGAREAAGTAGAADMSVGLQRLRDEPDVIRKGAIDKGEDPAVVDRALELDARRRQLLGESEALKAERNAASKRIGEAIKGGAAPDGPEVVGAQGRDRSRPASGSQRWMRSWPRSSRPSRTLLLRIPNPADPDVPVGGEDANVTVRTWGEILARDAPVEGEVGADAPAGGATWSRKPHWEIGEALDIIDNARGAKIAGSGFPVYKGAGSALQRALISWFLDVHTRENGFTEVWPPAVVNTASATGTGQIPDKEDQMYVVTRDELYLVPTAEVPGHEPAPRRDPRGRRRCRSATPPTRRASGARPGRPARTPAGSCGSTSSTRSRWSSSSGRRTRRRRSSG